MNRRPNPENLCRMYAGVALAVLLSAAAAWGVWLATPELSPEQFAAIIREMGDWTLNDLRPQPRENAAFLAGILSLPFAGIAAWFCLRRRKVPAAWVWGISILTLLGFAGTVAGGKLFAHLLFSPLKTWPGILLFAAVCLLLRHGLRRRLIGKRFAFGVAAALFLLHLLAFKLLFPEAVATTPSPAHFGTVAYSVAATCGGAYAPSLYGSYPGFLMPLLLLTGISVFKLSLILTALFLAGLLAMLYPAVRLIRNPLLPILFAGSLMLTACGYGVMFFDLYDPYFQYHPIRSFWPMAIPLAAWWIVRKNQPIRGGLTAGILMAAALFWNTDSGVVVAAAFFGWFFWNAVSRRQSAWWRGFACQWAGFAGALVFFYLLMCLWGGGPPDLPALYLYQRLYYLGGYYMLPMPGPFHLWTPVLLLYAGSFLWSLLQVYRAPNHRYAQMMLFTSLLGFGLFLYYQGRSDDRNLISAAFPALFLATLAGDRFSRLLLRTGWKTPLLPFWLGIMLFLALSFSACMLKLPTTFRLAGRHLKRMVTPPRALPEEYAFIRENAPPDRVANILGSIQGFYSIETGVLPAFAPSNYFEILTRKDMNAFMKQLVLCRKPLFISAHGLYQDWRVSDAFLDRFFELKAVSPGGRMLYYVPRESIEIHSN